MRGGLEVRLGDEFGHQNLAEFDQSVFAAAVGDAGWPLPDVGQEPPEAEELVEEVGAGEDPDAGETEEQDGQEGGDVEQRPHEHPQVQAVQLPEEHAHVVLDDGSVEATDGCEVDVAVGAAEGKADGDGILGGVGLQHAQH